MIFFINVADSIGQGISFDSETHPSICKIRENKKVEVVSFDSESHPSICKIRENEKVETSFSFSCIDESKVSKLFDKLQIKKETGVDKLSCKILKLGKTCSPVPSNRLDKLVHSDINLSWLSETCTDGSSSYEKWPNG